MAWISISLRWGIVLVDPQSDAAGQALLPGLLSSKQLSHSSRFVSLPTNQAKSIRKNSSNCYQFLARDLVEAIKTVQTGNYFNKHCTIRNPSTQ
jgi:hypothetical protein